MYARVRPSAVTRRASTRSSSPTSKTPSTYASLAPGRTIPDFARPPRSRSSACARTVLPAPVSPVRTLRPGARRSSARSIRRGFSTRSSESTVPGLPAPGDGFCSALQHPPHGGHELLHLGVGLVRPLALAEQAVAGVAVEQAEGDLVERRLDCGDLGHHVGAVAVLLDHAAD